MYPRETSRNQVDKWHVQAEDLVLSWERQAKVAEAMEVVEEGALLEEEGTEVAGEAKGLAEEGMAAMEERVVGLPSALEQLCTYDMQLDS